MPKISEKGVYQHEHLSTEAKSPAEFFFKSIHNPMFVVKSLISPPEKIKTFFVSFLSFGLIPIFAPLGILLPVFTQFLLRFLYTGPQYTAWLNVNHHVAPAAILLPVAAIYGACCLAQKNKKSKKIFLILASLLFLSTFVQDIILKAPIHSLFKKQLYERQQWMRDNDEIVKIAQKIDKKIPIATQNSLFPHLSQRENIYLLPKIENASYIALDLREGPNKFAPMSFAQMKDFVQNLLAAKKYSIIYQKGEAMLLRKIEQ